MEFSDAVGLLDHLHENGVRVVIFGGGECFSWPGDVVALAGEAKARGMTVQAGTNGVDLPEGFAELSSFDRWVLPLESVDPAVHDALRHWGNGHHRLVVGRLDELRRASRSVTVSTVLTASNAGGVAELGRHLRAYHSLAENVHAWHLYQFLPLGRGGARNREELWISPERFREVCDSVQSSGLPFKVFRRSDMYQPRTIAFFWSKDGRVCSGNDALQGSAELPLPATHDAQ